MLERTVRIDREQIAVFAIGISHAARVDSGRVNAPFKAGRMVADTCDAVVGIARATKCVRVLEPPLNRQARSKRRDKVSFRITGI